MQSAAYREYDQSEYNFEKLTIKKDSKLLLPCSPMQKMDYSTFFGTSCAAYSAPANCLAGFTEAGEV